MSIWECDVCKKHFTLTNSRASDKIKKKDHGFCSKKCLDYWRKTETSKRVLNWVKKNGGSRLNNGSGLTTDGYIWIRVIGNGYHNNQIKLHRYLMEIKVGRKLQFNEIVHHINGDKLDNNIDNLQLVTRSEHNKIHKFLTKGVH